MSEKKEEVKEEIKEVEKQKTRLGKDNKVSVTTRDGKNYGYKYTDLAQINEYCDKNNITYYQYVEPFIFGVSETMIEYIWTVIIRDGKEESPRRGSRLVEATLQGKSNPAQEQGSSITYARRYSLLMALGLATEDDDAESLSRPVAKKPTIGEKPSTPTLPKATEQQITKIKEAYKEVDENGEVKYSELATILSTTEDKVEKLLPKLNVNQAGELITRKMKEEKKEDEGISKI